MVGRQRERRASCHGKLVGCALAEAEGVAEAAVAGGECHRRHQESEARYARTGSPEPEPPLRRLSHGPYLGAFRGFIKKPCTISMTTPTLIAASARLKAGQW